MIGWLNQNEVLDGLGHTCTLREREQVDSGPKGFEFA